MLRSTATKTGLALIFGLSSLSASAQDNWSETEAISYETAASLEASTDASDSDRDVSEQVSLLQRLAIFNASEIRRGSLILERARTKAARAYAKALIADHLQVSDLLRDLAEKKGAKFTGEKLVEAAMKFKEQEQTELSALEKLGMVEFKNILTEKSQERHRRALVLLKAIKDQRNEPDMKRLAEIVSYTIQKHQKMAEILD